MGTNLSKRFPSIYKYGRFKKALRYWKEEQYIKAYKEIAEVFNIDHIKKTFNPTYDPHKNQSVMFSKDRLKLENDGPKPQEDFGDAANHKFLEDVYILLMFLESHEKDLQKSIKEVEGMLQRDRIRTRQSRSRHPGAKIMMCPLKDECPEDIRPRWPSSSTKTISKFGKRCEFAHHAFELKFKQELAAKKKMLNKTLEDLNKKLDSDYQRPPFNPGGNVFTDCIGCGEELRRKGVSKGVCSSCQLRKGVNQKLQVYRQKAAMKYSKITQQKSFNEHYTEKLEDATRLNTKLGYYRKACVLYDNQRYKDAFTYIAKAVEIVKNEKTEEHEKEEKKSHDLKVKL
jgi:tetratricopeptide (TPR) repeat protein